MSPDGAGTAEATVDGSAVSSAQEGESVRLSSTANAGYRFKEWAVSGAAAADPSLVVTSFTMGTEDVTATAVFERVYTIESVSCTSSGVASYFGDPYQLDAGTSVTPHFSSDSGEPPAGSVQISIFGIYTDPSYASITELTTEPVEGTTYYSYFQLSDAAANSGVIDYSHLDASSVSISVTGYTTNVTGITSMLPSGVRIGFSLEKNAPAVTTYPVWVGSTQVTSANKDNVLGDGKVSFEPGTNTLTVTGTPAITGNHLTALISAEGIDLTIDAPAGLTLSSGSEYGVYIANGGLTVNGSVSATTYDIPLAVWNGDLVVNGSVNAVCTGGNHALAAKSVTITDDVTASGHAAIYANGDVTITGNAKLTGTNNCGVYTTGNITLSGGSFTIVGSDAALWSGKDITVNGDLDATSTVHNWAVFGKNITLDGKVKANGKHGGIDCYSGNLVIHGDAELTGNGNCAVCCAGNILIEGKVDASSSDYIVIQASSNITITGDVTVTGAQSGLHAGGGTITVNGDVNATSTVTNHAIYGKVVDLKGDVTANGSMAGISAADSLTIGGDADVTGKDNCGIYCGGDVTIQGSATVKTLAKLPAIEAGGKITVVSGTWTLDGGNRAVSADQGIVIPATHGITAPVGGVVTLMELDTTHGHRTDCATVTEFGGATEATHVVIEPKQPLPKVIGLKAHVSGTELSGGQYRVKADSMETLFESATAPVTMSAAWLYTEQTCTNILTAEPAPGAAYYFILNVYAFDEGTPPTLEWAANDVITAGSTLTADNAAVEIVELSHGPTGGSLSAIVKFTPDAAPTYSVSTVITPSGAGGVMIFGGSSFAAGEPVQFVVNIYSGYELGGSFTMPASDVTITAVFQAAKPTQVTVSFESNGGSLVPAQTLAYGATATQPADPGRPGFDFGGWFQDVTLSVPFDFATPITADVTVYAKWLPVSYAVVSGGNATWVSGSGTAQTVTVKRDPNDDACFGHFTAVLLDGMVLAPGDYTAASGSTVVTLPAATLQNLSVGTHTVTVQFDDGQAQTRLTVAA